jgi:YesN/AraC family two-component response regulator
MHEAESREAVPRLRADSFFALLTDQMMPDITGVDLVRRARSVDSRLRGIVLSGYSRPEGVDLTWFRKPVDTDALVTALRRAN